MADKIVLVDTSILIDLFRKTDKANSTLLFLVRQGYAYSISAVTEYEIYTGAAFGKLIFGIIFSNERKCFRLTKLLLK